MNYYVTTSIAYTNAEPHIGYALELLYGDVLARYARQQGEDVTYSTGTDEHGGKIAEKAQENGMQPQFFVDQMSQKFRDLASSLNVSNDRFIRTTDKGHEQRAQIIWDNLSKYIYKGSYEGWYCTGDEAYFTESVVKENKGICPNHNRKYEKIQEENYFFKLSAFADQIKEAIATDSLRILPETRKNEILSVINEGLDDVSISRPKDKISWGIPVPGDSNHVMYVWFEAVMNYITVLGYPEHSDFKSFWPADVQVIGKDILRFHAAIWPGILLGLGLPLPKTLFVHGFISVDGKKMSKTLGNVIAPDEIIKKYGVDPMRYFFLRHIPAYDDGDFSWDKLDVAYNTELANELGNAVQRTLSMIITYQNGVIGDTPEAGHDIAQYQEAMHNCRFDQALDEVWDLVRGLNKYIEESKPWAVAKGDDPAHLKEILAYQVGALVQIADLLEPFMPDTAVRIRNIFDSGIVAKPKASLFPRSDQKKPLTQKMKS